MSTINTKPRNQNIDLLKILAMLGVMCLHTTLLFDTIGNPISRILFTMSGLSMPIFFMVSGYLMIGRDITKEYIAKKIFKIIRFVFLSSLLIRSYSLLKQDITILAFIKGCILCFFQRGGIGVYWYFGAIIILYAILPVINKISKLKWLLSISLISLFIVCNTIQTLNLTVGIEKSIPQNLRLWNWLFYFMLGGCIHKYEPSINDHLTKIVDNIFPPGLRKKAAWFSWGGGKMLIINVLAIMYVFFYYVQEQFVGAYSIEYFFGSSLCAFFAVLCFIVIVTLKKGDSWIIRQLSLVFLPVYALHMSVIGILSSHWHIDVGFLTPLVQLLSVWTITIALGILIISIPIMNKIFRI